jgi:uncharacterized membrane protein YeiH
VLAALAGCTTFVAMRTYLALTVAPSLVAILVTFALRLLAIRFNWRTRAAARRWGTRATADDASSDPLDAD